MVISIDRGTTGTFDARLESFAATPNYKAGHFVCKPCKHRVHQTCKWRKMMLWTLIVILMLLWLVAVVVKFTVGGLIHVLLLGAVALLVYRLLT